MKFISKILSAVFFFSAILLFINQPISIAQEKDTYATINGEKIWYQLKGEGDPIVLIPGGPGDSHLYFTPWFDVLAQKHRVIYYRCFRERKIFKS